VWTEGNLQIPNHGWYSACVQQTKRPIPFSNLQHGICYLVCVRSRLKHKVCDKCLWSKLENPGTDMRWYVNFTLNRFYQHVINSFTDVPPRLKHDDCDQILPLYPIPVQNITDGSPSSGTPFPNGVVDRFAKDNNSLQEPFWKIADRVDISEPKESETRVDPPEIIPYWKTEQQAPGA
jgi:hypothetical protein